MGTVFNIQRYCLHDGDGIRTTVFFKGCPLRCIWCHNPEGLSVDISVSYNSEKCTLCARCVAECPGRSIENGAFRFDREKCTSCGKCVENCLLGANELIGKQVDADEVIKEVLKDRIYYRTSGGGMTLSGGEPSMQAEFALELIEKARNEGITTFVETCGIGTRTFYEKALGLGCVFLFDIKCIDPLLHKKLTSVGNERIFSNLEFLFDKGAEIVLRLPLIPSVNDSDEDIDALSDFLKKNRGKYRYAEIMPYHSFGAAKAERLGKENVFVGKDAAEEDKLRWQKMFIERGADVRISQ